LRFSRRQRVSHPNVRSTTQRRCCTLNPRVPFRRLTIVTTKSRNHRAKSMNPWSLRENTERPVTLTAGTNVLVGHDMGRLQREAARVLAVEPGRGEVPPLWDGHAGERIADILTSSLVGPFANFHHQALLIAALWPEG
jgi:UDP-N-acetylglucosamine 2-epimerase